MNIRSIGPSLLVAASLIGGGAIAQDTADTAAAEPDDVIRVVGFRTSLANSLDAKRNANQVIDVITAEEIGQFPDQNIAEAIQRITGVQITRNNGEGETVNIRGLSANFTRVEVDGRSAAITIDSADPERQSVLSVFASDLYSEIEVVKSPTAADIEGGVGGIVRLKTPSPLDIGELSWGADLGYTYSEVREDVEPSLNGFFSNVFMDGKLGVLVGGTFEDRDRSLDKFQNNDDWWTIGSRTNGSVPDNVAVFEDAFFAGRIRQEQRDETADKYNINAKVQFQPADTLELYANTYYTLEERDRSQSRIQTAFRRGRPRDLADLGLGFTDPIIVDDSGTVLAAAFNGVRTEPVAFRRLTDIETTGLTGGIEWDVADWFLSAEANMQESEEAFTETRVSSRENRLLGYSIVNDPEYPEILTPAGAFDPAGFSIRDLDQQERTIRIEETSFRFDAERALDFGVLSSVEAGVRFASTEFDRRQGQVNSPEERGDLTLADGLAFVVDGSFAGDFGGQGVLRDWPSVDPVEFYNRFPGEGEFLDNANADENLYALTEETLAGYVLANYDAGDLAGLYARGNFGVRVVETRYSGDGAVDLAGDAIDDFGNIGSQSLERDYVDVLPAFNVVLSQTPDANVLVRGAVTRALTRPNIQAINPGLVIRIDDVAVDETGAVTGVEGTFEEGNPDLDPFRAWQYDLGFEWYLGEQGESAITAALFYKDVENFVLQINEARDLTVGDLGAAADLLGVPLDVPADIVSGGFAVNGGEAEIQGFEIGVQAPFTFLPGPWSDFGVFANYTYTDSEFTSADGVSQPFPGASENSFNVVGYYERAGFSARLAYNYRDAFLIEPFRRNFTPEGDNAVFGDAQGRLDLALRYRLENGFRVSLDALNLTEEQTYKYYDIDQRLEDLEVEGPIYSFRVGYVY